MSENEVIRRIRGSQGGEYEDAVLRVVIALMMKAKRTSETLIIL